MTKSNPSRAIYRVYRKYREQKKNLNTIRILFSKIRTCRQFYRTGNSISSKIKLQKKKKNSEETPIDET